MWVTASTVGSGTFTGQISHTPTVSDDSPYERVTNLERFAPLHEGAAALVADLTREFDISVETVEPEQGHGGPEGLSATRLSPTGGGAPVTITATALHGLFVRFGERHTEWFPQCGCDACDEQPDEVLADLQQKLLGVAAGRFREVPGGYEFRYEGGWAFGRDPSVTASEAPTRDYVPWTRR
jgi:hypothetical protein